MWTSDRLTAQTEPSLGAKDITAGGNDQETKCQVQLPRVKLTASVKGPRGGGDLSPDQESLHHRSRSQVAHTVCNTICMCAPFLGVQTVFIRKWKQSKTPQQELHNNSCSLTLDAESMRSPPGVSFAHPNVGLHSTYFAIKDSGKILENNPLCCKLKADLYSKKDVWVLEVTPPQLEAKGN